jgi:hypothetical protein
MEIEKGKNKIKKWNKPVSRKESKVNKRNYMNKL